MHYLLELVKGEGTGCMYVVRLYLIKKQKKRKGGFI